MVQVTQCLVGVGGSWSLEVLAYLRGVSVPADLMGPFTTSWETFTHCFPLFNCKFLVIIAPSTHIVTYSMCSYTLTEKGFLYQIFFLPYVHTEIREQKLSSSSFLKKTKLNSSNVLERSPG